jgi:type I restriction enzyme S subunit
MRDGWLEASLDEIADVIMGQSPDGKSYNELGEGIPFMQGSAEFGEHYPIPEKWCSDPKKIAERGDLLLSVRAPVGDTNFADQRIAVGRGLSVIRANEKSLTEYIRLVVQHNVSELIASSGTGMFASITGNNLRKFKVLVPPMYDQKRIVDLISSLDSYIEALQQQLETAKKSRNAVLNSLLSAVGDDWTELKLSEVTRLVTDGSHFSPKTLPSGVPYATVRDIKEGFLDLENAARISEESFLELEKNGCRPLMDDILFSKDGTVGKVALVQTRARFVVLSSLAIVRADVSHVLPKFLALTMAAERFQRDAIGSKTGLAIKRIVLKHLKTLKVLIPPIAFQKKVIDDMAFFDSHLDSLTKVISESTRMRASMLHALLSGEHQIPESYDKVMDGA